VPPVPSPRFGRVAVATLSGCVVVCLTLAASVGAQQRPSTSPLHGALEPGRHAVGFTTLELRDPTRYDRPKVDQAGNPAAGNRLRRFTVHVWYPAAAAAGRPMTFEDYMFSHFPDTVSEATRRTDEANRRRFFAQFGSVSDSAWNRLKATVLLGRRDAAAASGRFPLIVGSLRRLSTTVTNEYLASHGYVVAMSNGFEPDTSDPGVGLETAVRDMETMVAELRKLPYVDPTGLAALGFSGSGFSQILFAMRHPDVDAVADLESAIFDDRVFWPLSGGWGYNPTAMRAAFLHTYSVPLARRENRFADFEAMRYSNRHHYLVDAPGIHHWDFAVEGMAASTVLGVRGANGPRLQRAFETTNRYVLAFFNAYVKRDAAEMSFLRRNPAANGAPAGLATIRELPAVEPAPSVQAFEALVAERGIDSAMVVFRSARERDPQAQLFTAVQLNRLGYRLLRARKVAQSIPIFRAAVELSPQSANGYDSLAEALEAAGQTADALAMSRRGLDVLSREQLTPEQRQAVKAALDGRIQRLGGSP
jgi:hypothetical protein